MVELRKADLAQQFNDSTGNQTIDGIPQKVGNIVSPTFTMNQLYSTRAFGAASSATGTMSIVQIQSDRDFYLTAAILSVAKNAACDVATGQLYIYAITSGLTSRYAAISVLTATDQHSICAVSFPYPVKIDKGSLIQANGTFTAGAMTRDARIFGFYL